MMLPTPVSAEERAYREAREELWAMEMRVALAFTELANGRRKMCIWWLKRAIEGDVKLAPPVPRPSRVEGRFDATVAFENLQSALEAADCRPYVSPTGQGSALCPAHDDRGASLRFKEDGRLLINCRAGCETDEVLAALNTDWSTLGGLR